MSAFAAFELGALRWLLRHEEDFTVDRDSDERGLLRSLKRVADLAQLAEVLARTPRHAQVGRGLLEHCWAEIGRGELLAELLERRGLYLILSAIYQPFVRRGLRSDRVERVLRSIVPEDILRPSHLVLVAVTLDELDASPWPVDEVLAEEWRKLVTAERTLSSRDVYSITHLVFYRAAWGARPGGMREDERRWLSENLPALVDRFTAVGHLDMLAELALAAHCGAGSCAAPPVWDSLFKAQHADGLVPYWVAEHHPMKHMDTSNPERHRFRENYHTTLVALMVCAVCTHPLAAT